MLSIKLDKRLMRLVTTALIISLFVLLALALGVYQDVALAAPDSADPLAPGSDLLFVIQTQPPPVAPPPVPPPSPEKRCKLIVIPDVFTTGEPDEVCWLGNKNSDLKIGPAIIEPDGAEYYAKPEGKGLVCHQYTINQGELLPGTYFARCIGEDGTILVTTVKIENYQATSQ